MNNKEEKMLLSIGSLVEDAQTGELYQIIDKGANYITVATSNGLKKKWVNEVVETQKEIESDFSLVENGQIECFGFTSKNLDSDISQTLLFQFEEFKDLYAEHQILKRLDEALEDTDVDSKYEKLLKVQSFYDKKDIPIPFVLESELINCENTKIVKIFCEALGVEFKDSLRDCINECMAIVDNLNEKQKEILNPFIKLADKNGLISEDIYDKIFDVMEESLDQFDVEIEDLDEAFSDDDFGQEILTKEVLNEVLSAQGRMALSRDLKRRETSVTIKRERALSRAVGSGQLLARARKLALTMIKRRMFRKPVDQMSRAEKERFELGASKRKALVSRLAQKLVGKVRMLQNERLHGHSAATQATHHVATGGGS